MCYHPAFVDGVGGYDDELATAEDLDLYVCFLLAGQLQVVARTSATCTASTPAT